MPRYTHGDQKTEACVASAFFFLPAESSYGSHLIFNNTVFKNGQICPKNRSILGNLFITFKVRGVL